jgi:hypothetical protein
LGEADFVHRLLAAKGIESHKRRPSLDLQGGQDAGCSSPPQATSSWRSALARTVRLAPAGLELMKRSSLADTVVLAISGDKRGHDEEFVPPQAPGRLRRAWFERGAAQRVCCRPG